MCCKQGAPLICLSDSNSESEDGRRPAAYSARTGRLLSALDNRSTNSSGSGSARGRNSSAAGRLLARRRTPLGLGGADLDQLARPQPPFKLLGLDKPDEREKPATASRLSTAAGRSSSALGRATPRAATAMSDGRRSAIGNGTAPAPPSATADRSLSANGAPDAAESANSPATEMAAREYLVLRVLCQLLHTEDLRSVRAWLREAPPHEKGLALELVKKSIAASSKDDGRLEAPPEDWRSEAWKPFHVRSTYETTYAREFCKPVQLKPIDESSEWSSKLAAEQPAAQESANESNDTQSEENGTTAPDILVVNSGPPEAKDTSTNGALTVEDLKLEQTSAAAGGVPAPPSGVSPASRPALRLRTARCSSSTGPLTSRTATAGPSKAAATGLNGVREEQPRAKDESLDTADLCSSSQVGSTSLQNPALKTPAVQQLRREPIRPVETASSYAEEVNARRTRAARAPVERTKSWDQKIPSFALPVK